MVDLDGLWRSLVSASVWGTEGRGFESRQPDQPNVYSTSGRHRVLHTRAVPAGADRGAPVLFGGVVALRHRSRAQRPIARRAGELCHSAHSTDPIEAAVVLDATGTTSVIATSDPKDVRQLTRSLPSELGTAITVLPV